MKENAIVVGCGLGGITAALSLGIKLDKKHRVLSLTSISRVQRSPYLRKIDKNSKSDWRWNFNRRRCIMFSQNELEPRFEKR
jgi:hypothetical protein